jgi:hypothetical protein
LYNILIEFWVLMELVSMIKMYLNETYSEVHISKYLSIIFLSRMVRNKEMLYGYCFSTLL